VTGARRWLVAQPQIGEDLAMASIGGPRPHAAHASERSPIAPRPSADGLEDPVACAARVIADEVRSIFRAVDAKTSAIDADARERAQQVRRSASASAEPARARLEAISRDLESLARDLDGAAKARAARLGRVS
jgi:hypothetical protein